MSIIIRNHSMGHRTQALKILLLEVVIVALVVGAGYLGWQNVSLRRQLHDRWGEVVQLEQERRKLQAQVIAPLPAKPEEQAEVRRQIEQRTSALRELPFKQPVTYKLIERQQLHDTLVKLIEEQYSPEEIQHYKLALQTLGVIPPKTDLLKLWLGLYNEQVGAFYVPESHALYTFKDLSLSGALDRMVLAHELTHALQDQHFDLTKLPLKVKDNDDLALASSALIEGDATVLMTQFYAENLDRSNVLQDLAAMLRQRTDALRNAPPFLRELLLFPYAQGQKFANALYLRGGMAELNKAYRKPPTSTEQILHPEKFLGADRDEPTPITMPTFQSKSWQVIWENTLGEFGVQQLLLTRLRFAAAQLAAEGWDGDRFRVYQSADGKQTALVWLSVWDTERDAVEFEEAYNEWSGSRKLPVVKIKRDGIYVTILQSDEKAFLQEWEQASH